MVPEAAWRDEFYRRVFIEDANPNTKKSAFQRVISDLTRLGHVAGYAGKFWTAAPEGADGANGANGANAPHASSGETVHAGAPPYKGAPNAPPHAAADLPDSEAQK